MVPLMITSALSYFISRSANTYSIYTKPLAESGELMSHEDKDATVLHMMKLKYLIEKDYLELGDKDLISELMPIILQSKRNIFPVIGDDRALKGLIYVEDLLKTSLNSSLDSALIVLDLMQQAPDVVIITDSLKVVLNKMEKENVWLLPVLNEDNQYIGFVSKTAIFNKYRALLSRQADYMG